MYIGNSMTAYMDLQVHTDCFHAGAGPGTDEENGPQKARTVQWICQNTTSQLDKRRHPLQRQQHMHACVLPLAINPS